MQPDVSEMCSRLQNIYSVSWQAFDSLYCLVSIFWTIFGVSVPICWAFNRHVTSELLQTASLLSCTSILGGGVIRGSNICDVMYPDKFWWFFSSQMPGKMTPRSWMFLKKLTVLQLVKNILYFTEFESKLPSLQEPASCLQRQLNLARQLSIKADKPSPPVVCKDR
jgi:hypothetical protein